MSLKLKIVSMSLLNYQKFVIYPFCPAKIQKNDSKSFSIKQKYSYKFKKIRTKKEAEIRPPLGQIEVVRPFPLVK
jgi:hypothetical protein